MALIDARGITRAFFIRERDDHINVFSEVGVIKDFGLIVGSDLMFGNGRRFLVHTRRCGLSISIFRDNSTASKWIKKAVQELQ